MQRMSDLGLIPWSRGPQPACGQGLEGGQTPEGTGASQSRWCGLEAPVWEERLWLSLAACGGRRAAGGGSTGAVTVQ